MLKSDESAFVSGREFNNPATGKPAGCLSPLLAAAAGQAAAEISRIAPLETSQSPVLYQGKGREGIERLISARLIGVDWLALLVPFILGVASLLLALAPRRREGETVALPDDDVIEGRQRYRGEAGE